MHKALFHQADEHISHFLDRPEHGDEQVEQQDVGDQQEDDQQQYDQPVGVDVGTRRPLATDDLLRVICAVDLGHAGRCAGRIKGVEASSWTEKLRRRSELISLAGRATRRRC